MKLTEPNEEPGNVLKKKILHIQRQIKNHFRFVTIRQMKLRKKKQSDLKALREEQNYCTSSESTEGEGVSWWKKALLGVVV